MLEVKDKASLDIGGCKYEITLLSTSRAFITGQDLLKLAAPAAGAGLDGFMNGDNILDAPETFAAMALHLTSQLGNIDTLEIIKELLAELTVGGAPVPFDTYFRGHLDHLRKIIEFAIMENYSSLFIDMSLKERFTTFMQEFQTQTQTLTEDNQLESQSK